jgi:hypothetical protein
MFSEPHSSFGSGLVPLNQAPSTFTPPVADTRRLHAWASASEIEVALGRAIWAERGCAVGQALHWMGGHELLAVVDTRHGDLSYRSKLRRETLSHAHVVVRPASASFSPQGFVRKKVHDVLWQYGYYAPDAVEQLPARMFTELLVVKPHNVVTPGLLTLRHAAILDALAAKPQTIANLSRLLDMPVAQLTKALAPLYLARCISTRSPSGLARSLAHVGRFIGRGTGTR